jgi:putative acetyltransferase
MTSIVRTEDEADVPAIFAIHRSCFPSDGEARLVDALRTAGCLTVSLVAVVNDEIVGHIAFSPVTTQDGATGLGLAPLAVVKEHRQKGIGAHLVRTGILACKTADYGWTVVLGDPDYYSRFDFEPASKFGLSDEFGGGEHFQAVELIAGQLPTGAGLVRYAPEFNAFA